MAVFVLLGTIQVTVIAAITMLTVALPEVKRDLHASDAGLVWVSAAYSLSFGGLLLLGGRMADLVGARPVLGAGLAILGIASAFGAVAPTLAMLVGARAVQGIGAALAAPAAFSLLLTVFPHSHLRAAILARWGVLSGLGAGVGVAVFGAVSAWVSWRWLFAAPCLISATALAFSSHLPSVRPPPPDRAGRYRAGGVLLRERGMALAAVAASSATMATVFFVLSLRFQAGRGFTPLQTSLALLPAIPAIWLSGSLSGRLMQRFGSHQLLATGLVVSATGTILLGMLPPLASTAGLLTFCLGAGLTFSAATVEATQRLSPAQTGSVGGLLNTAMEIGPAIGLAVLPAAGHSLSARPGTSATLTYDFCAALLTVVILAAVVRWLTSDLPSPEKDTLP